MSSRDRLLLIGIAIPVLFLALGQVDLWDRDEPRNAACAREMWQRGDWVVPTFNGELRAHKPVLLYWLMMASYSVFGVTEFAARFASAALGVGTILLTYQLGCQLYHRGVAMWGALLLTTALLFGVSSRAATPDATLLFCMMLSLTLFARGIRISSASGGPPWPSRRRDMAYVGGALGLAVLAKGPVGAVLPLTVMALYRLLAEPKPAVAVESLGGILSAQLKLFTPRRVMNAARSLYPWTVVGVLMLVALPWYLAVHIQTDGAFSREFLGTHNLERFQRPLESHRGPIFYHLIAVAVGMFPASVFLGPSLAKWVKRVRQGSEWQAGDRLLALWVAVIVCFFSLAGTKLPNYTLPVYPAMALLFGAFLHNWLQTAQHVDLKWFRAAMVCAIVAAVGVAVSLPVSAHQLWGGDVLFALPGLVLCLAGAIALVLAERGRRESAVGTFLAGSIAFSLLAWGVVAPRVDAHQHAAKLMDSIRETRQTETPQIAAFGHFHSTYVYYADQRVQEVANRSALAELLQGTEEVFVIVPEPQLGALDSELPRQLVQVTSRRRFLRDHDLVLMRAEAAEPQTARTADSTGVSR